MVLRAWKPQALGFLAIASAVAVTLVAAPGASGGHEDCTLTSGAPVPFYGSANAFTTATIECGSFKNWIRVTLVLTRDGTVADTSDRMCHKRSDCWTYVFAQDPPGDQTWCAHASGRIGPHSIPEITFCEATTEL
jgi:hypothetical protein